MVLETSEFFKTPGMRWENKNIVLCYYLPMQCWLVWVQNPLKALKNDLKIVVETGKYNNTGAGGCNVQYL